MILRGSGISLLISILKERFQIKHVKSRHFYGTAVLAHLISRENLAYLVTYARKWLPKVFKKSLFNRSWKPFVEMCSLPLINEISIFYYFSDYCLWHTIVELTQRNILAYIWLTTNKRDLISSLINFGWEMIKTYRTT